MLSIGPALIPVAAAGFGSPAQAVASAPYRTLGDMPAAAQLAISAAIQQEAKLTASNGTVGSYFGDSVASSGNTVVVGAPNTNSLHGSAYVFTEPASGWADMTQVATLTASDGAACDNFGVSVAINGNTIVVGADTARTGLSSPGAAYVFTMPTAGWTTMTQTAKLTASDVAASSDFGVSVAVSGNTVVVGSDAIGNRQGAAYVFARPAAGWTNMTQTAKLTASNGVAWDRLGLSVATSGDTVVAGADRNGSHPGTAYVYVKPAAGWANMTETARLTASDSQAQAEFGVSVAASGDTIVVGADNADNFHGAAYVFTKPAAGWKSTTETAKLTGSERRPRRQLWGFGGHKRRHGGGRGRRPERQPGRSLRLHQARRGLDERDAKPQADGQRRPRRRLFRRLRGDQRQHDCRRLPGNRKHAAAAGATTAAGGDNGGGSGGDTGGGGSGDTGGGGCDNGGGTDTGGGGCDGGGGDDGGGGCDGGGGDDSGGGCDGGGGDDSGGGCDGGGGDDSGGGCDGGGGDDSGGGCDGGGGGDDGGGGWDDGGCDDFACAVGVAANVGANNGQGAAYVFGTPTATVTGISCYAGTLDGRHHGNDPRCEPRRRHRGIRHRPGRHRERHREPNRGH